MGWNEKRIESNNHPEDSQTINNFLISFINGSTSLAFSVCWTLRAGSYSRLSAVAFWSLQNARELVEWMNRRKMQFYLVKKISPVPYIKTTAHGERNNKRFFIFALEINKTGGRKMQTGRREIFSNLSSIFKGWKLPVSEFLKENSSI